MITGTTTVISDNTELRTVLGVHDANLATLELCFGAPVRVRGNELGLETHDQDLSTRFAAVIETLRRLAREGHEIESGLIRSVHGQTMRQGVATLSEHPRGLAIPQGYQKVYPRTPAQAQFLQALANHDMVFGIGPAGTGKTYLAIAHALTEILSHKKKKLILTRPVVEAGESLGFLPGDLAQKLDPYVRPLYDAMDNLVPPEVISRLEELRVIEIAPLAYMRGRSLKDCYVVLDEAQNTTREQMKMFLTRMGEGTRAVITGDITQIDLPSRKSSGLVHAMEILKDIPAISFAHFSSVDVVRSPLVRAIIQAYEGGA